MQFKVGEWIVLSTVDKAVLAKCTKAEKPFKAVIQVPGGDDEHLEFKGSDVIANLGENPRFGSVHGLTIEPLRRTVRHEFWGDIRLYQVLDEVAVSDFRKGLKRVQAKIERNKFPVLPLEVDVRHPKGKTKGMFKHRPTKDTDLMTLRVGSDDLVEGDFDEIVSHEYAHGLWFRNMTLSERLKWVHLYHKFVTLIHVTKKQLDGILEDVEAENDIGAFMRGCDAETLIIFKECLRHIKNVHSLDKHHLQMCLSLNESIGDYWPESLEISEKEIAVDTYAHSSPEELFATSFSFWFSGKKLPKVIQSLLDSSISKFTKG